MEREKHTITVPHRQQLTITISSYVTFRVCSLILLYFCFSIYQT